MSYLCRKTSFVFKGFLGYPGFMRIMNKDEIIQKHPEITERLKIISFFNKYDYQTTKDAFCIGRSTIYFWKKKLTEKGPLGLANHSRRPYNTRRMFIDPEIFKFIKSLREKYPRIGKEKIKILLDEYCQEENLKPVSVSKVGRIIKRNNWFFYLGNRSKKGKQVIRDKKRVFGYEVKRPGDLFQIDTLVRFEHGIKRYLLTAIDVVSKFSFAFAYKSHSTQSAADFAQKLIRVTPYPIKAIQTDNGSEFLRVFDQTIAKNGIVHFFIYPRCPKQNGVIERFNRTIQEEFVEDHRELLEHKGTKQFNNLLMDYLLFYNTKRPHHSLGLKEPMRIVTNYLRKSNMCWTDTFSCFGNENEL